MGRRSVFVLVIIMAIIVLATMTTGARTSLEAARFNTTDFNFSSGEYISEVVELFNTSQTEEKFVLISSMNIKKLSGDSTNTVSMRISFDGTVVAEENLRTLSQEGDEGSTGTAPLNLTAKNVGEHNITIEFKRTGAGSISVNDMDIVLVCTRTHDSGFVNTSTIGGTYTHSSQDYIEAFNFTINKTRPSSHLLLTTASIKSNRTNPVEYAGNQGEANGINMSSNVALYHLNETGGTITDHSGQGNSGSATGISYNTSAIFGNGTRFDGVDDYITIGNTNDINTQTHSTRTVEIWFQVQDKAKEEKQVLYEEGGGCQRTQHLHI